MSNATVYNAVEEASVIHCGSNLSDHSPINCKIKVGDLNLSLEEETKRKVPSWTKASQSQQEQCISSITKRLSNVNIPDSINCKNVHCSLDNHKEELETYSMAVLESLDEAAWECLPTAGGGNGTKKEGNSQYGWNTYVKDYQTEAKFWGAIHKSDGSPKNGVLNDIARHTKMQYHHAVRRLKRTTTKLQNDQFVQSLASNKNGKSMN